MTATNGIPAHLSGTSFNRSRRLGRPTMQEGCLHDYTTGEVARLFRVSSRTVCKWIDRGLMPGYRFPGTAAERHGDRRVAREGLLAFCRDQHYPVPSGLGCDVLALVEPALLERLARLLPAVTLTGARTPFEAGATCVLTWPRACVLSLALLGTQHLADTVAALRDGTGPPPAVLIVSPEYTAMWPDVLVDPAPEDVAARLHAILTGGVP